MRYEVEFKPRALKDLRQVPAADAARILERIDQLRDGLAGDVKRLTKLARDYRLRVGDYRVLFDVEGGRAVVWRVLHRRDAYRT